MRYHTLAWLAWLSAAALVALTNQQPLHSLLLILAVGLIFTQASRHNPEGQGWRTFLRLGLSVWAMGAILNFLSVHVGDRVLFTLPSRWPLVGGRITLEALLYGLANGASLFAVLLVFATFNLGVEMHLLLRWIPAGLYQAGLVASIALAFVPQMAVSLSDIRDAQRVRGHKFRGVRDLIPLVVPLITTALERSLTLAESMEARGFGGIVRPARPLRRLLLRLATLGGLVSLLAGLISGAMYRQAQWLSFSLVALGLALSVGTVVVQGRAVKRTHFRHEIWRACDTWATIASVASLLLVMWIRRQDAQALSYYPYPPYSPWPTFSLGLGVAIMLLAAPAFLWTSADASGEQPIADAYAEAMIDPQVNQNVDE